MNYFDRQSRSYLSRSERGLWSRVRHFEREAIFEELDPQPGERILDVGCGPGYYAREMQRRGAKVTGIDSSPAMLKQFQHLGAPAILGKFELHTFESSFDKILIAGAAEFIADIEAMLRQIERILLPQGRAVILAPRRNWLGGLYKVWHRHHGCQVSLHNYDAALEKLVGLKLRGIRNVTPMTCLIRLDRR